MQFASGLMGLFGGGGGAGGLLAGLSTLGGAFANRGGKSTYNRTVTPTFAPEVAPVLGDVVGQIRERLTNPGAGVDPLRIAARNRVNRAYDDAPTALADRFLSFGGGRSGKFGAALRKTELQRIRALSDLEPQFAAMTLDRGDKAVSLAEQLLSLGRGQKSEGEQTTPGNMLGGAFTGLGSSLGTLATLNMLDRMLKGGPAPAAGGGYGGGWADESYDWRES